MNIAYARKYPNSTTIEISFHYKNADIGIDREFNLNRNLDEKVCQTLERIKTNLEKEFRKKGGNKKKKGKPANTSNTDNLAESSTNAVKNTNASDVSVCVVNRNGTPLNDETWNQLFTTEEGMNTSLLLKVMEQDFCIAYNFPYVKQMLLPSVIMSRFSVYPAKLDVHFAQPNDCMFEWYRGVPKEKNNDTDIEWIKCGESFFYQVNDNDIRHKLKLKCTPCKNNLCGASVDIISKPLVEAGPNFSAFKTKQSFTPCRLSDGDKFRVVSYNLLADYYADSDYSRTQLFPYCPPYALAIDYRKQLFIKEILGYHSDIICMQEVDAKIFDLDLTVFLGHDGFEGTYQKKGDTAEGLATFFHKDKFCLVEKYGINLGENITVLPHFNDLYQKIKDNAKLCERMLALSTSLQVTILKLTSSNKYLLVANTHLYFHPDADHIRLLQIGFFMLYVKYIYFKTIDDLKLAESDLSIIFCGDFNSVPECGIYKLMTENEVPEDFIDFQSNAEEAVTKVLLQQPFHIRSAYNNPKYTNFTAGFAACLDYIFYQMDNLKLLQAVPLPSEEELSALVAIPSIYFPSDHISLVADFQLK